MVGAALPKVKAVVVILLGEGRATVEEVAPIEATDVGWLLACLYCHGGKDC